MESLKYLGNLGKKVQQFSWEVAEKDEVLAFAPISLSKTGASVREADQFSDLA